MGPFLPAQDLIPSHTACTPLIQEYLCLATSCFPVLCPAQTSGSLPPLLLVPNCPLVFCTHTLLILDHPWHLATNFSLFSVSVCGHRRDGKVSGVRELSGYHSLLPLPPPQFPERRQSSELRILVFGIRACWLAEMKLSRYRGPPASTLLPEVDSGNQEMTLTSK